MMRTQPPGFRWLVGGFALLAALAFGFQYRSTDEPTDLILGVLCLVTAGYWLIFDREPATGDSAEDSMAGDGLTRDGLARDGLARDGLGDDALDDGDAAPDRRPDRRHPG